jgi:hypothetical protein
MKIRITKITQLYPNGCLVQWTLMGPHVPGIYTFDIYRSETFSGPWELIAKDLTETYNYWDKFLIPSSDDYVRPNQFSMVRKFAYRVVANGPGGQSIDDAESEPNLAPKQKQLLRKILHDEFIALSKYNGVQIAVLKRRNWGERCKKCFDKSTKEIINSNCTLCWGTAFIGGFWNPVLTYSRRSPEQTTIQVSQEQKTEASPCELTLLNIPRVDHDDILVYLSDNRRFLVDQQTETMLRTVPVHQQVFAFELPRSHITYKIKVDPTTMRTFL